MSRQADVLAGLKERVEQAVQQLAEQAGWSEAPDVVERPANEPLNIPKQSLIVIRDLGTSTAIAEFGRGPNRAVRECSLRIQIEIYTRDQGEMDRDEANDELKAYIGETLEADPSLDGLIDDCTVDEADSDSFGEEGHDMIAASAITATLVWYSERALG